MNVRPVVVDIVSTPVESTRLLNPSVLLELSESPTVTRTTVLEVPPVTAELPNKSVAVCGNTLCVAGQVIVIVDCEVTVMSIESEAIPDVSPDRPPYSIM